MKPQHSQRSFLVHYARVMLSEARARFDLPGQRAFAWSLFNSACRSTREAVATPPHVLRDRWRVGRNGMVVRAITPAPDLFGAAA